MKRKIIKSIPLIIFAALTLSLVIGTIPMIHGILPPAEPTETILEAQSLKNIEPRSAFTIYVDIEPGRFDSILVETIYTQLKLYAGDVLIYECGQPGTYPAWLLDTPCLIKIVQLPEEASHLRFEYISPSQRTTVSLPALIAGSESALLKEFLITNSVVLIFSILILFIGLIATIVSLIYWRGDNAFLYYGLTVTAGGLWVFGECTATVFFIPHPAFLYIIALGGFFTVIVPLLRFGLIILSPKNPVPMRVCANVTGAAVIIAFACQLTGIAAFSKTLPVFQFLNLLGVAMFLGTVVWESFKHKSKIARQIILPTLILALAVAVEFANYNLRFTQILNPFFVSGAMIHIVWTGFIGARHVVLFQENERRLASEKASLENLNAMKTELLGNISHEMKTPLTVISNMSQLAAGHTSDDYVRDKMDIAVAEVERMKVKTNQLLKVAKLDDSAMKWDFEQVNIGALINETVHTYFLALDEHNNALSVELSEDLPDVKADKRHLPGVIVNLIENAVRHTRNGRITVRAIPDGNFVTISVEDTGCGMTPEQMERLFERFYTGDKKAGTGLGLYICKKTVEAHGGSIKVQSEPERGTTVTFTLPAIKN